MARSPLQVAAQRLMTGLHSAIYRWSNGRIGGKIGNAPMLLLYTTGRKTGQERCTPLLFGRDGERMILIGSNGGNETHPAWVHNLRAQGRARVRLGNRSFPVRVGEAQGEERARLWKMMVDQYSGYEGYQTKTTRKIPVVILTRSTTP